MAGNNSVTCRSVACRSDLPLSAQRRPIFLLVKWVNALIQQRPRTPEDLHLTFADGHTLCLLLQRLRPGTRLCKFSRAVTRATAMGNIEQALALVWNHLPTPSAMPSAAQILDGAPREINLRFVDQLYSIFVVRPARARLTAACKWLDELLAPYQLRLSDDAARPPHVSLGRELRTCVALAIALHSCLPASRCPELMDSVYWQPASETERHRSVRVVLAVLERERLAPCTADELLAAVRAPTPAATSYPGPFCGGSVATVSSERQNYFPLRSVSKASVASLAACPSPRIYPTSASPRNAAWAGGQGRGFSTPGGASAAHARAADGGAAGGGAAGGGGATGGDHWTGGGASCFGSGVPVTGGPPGGAELESELLGIILSAMYQRFGRAAPAYGTAGERRLLRFKDNARQRALPASVPPPTPCALNAPPPVDDAAYGGVGGAAAAAACYYGGGGGGGGGGGDGAAVCAAVRDRSTRYTAESMGGVSMSSSCPEGDGLFACPPSHPAVPSTHAPPPMMPPPPPMSLSAFEEDPVTRTWPSEEDPVTRTWPSDETYAAQQQPQQPPPQPPQQQPPATTPAAAHANSDGTALLCEIGLGYAAPKGYDGQHGGDARHAPAAAGMDTSVGPRPAATSGAPVGPPLSLSSTSHPPGAPAVRLVHSASALLAEVDDFLLESSCGAPAPPPLAPPPVHAPTTGTASSSSESAPPGSTAAAAAAAAASQHRRRAAAAAAMHGASAAFGATAMPAASDPAPLSESRYQSARFAWEAAAAAGCGGGGCGGQQPLPPSGAPHALNAPSSTSATPNSRLAPRNLAFASARPSIADGLNGGGRNTPSAPGAGKQQQAPPARPPQQGSSRTRQPKPTKQLHEQQQPPPNGTASHRTGVPAAAAPYATARLPHGLPHGLPSNAPTPVAFPGGWR